MSAQLLFRVFLLYQGVAEGGRGGRDIHTQGERGRGQRNQRTIVYGITPIKDPTESFAASTTFTMTASSNNYYIVDLALITVTVTIDV